MQSILNAQNAVPPGLSSWPLLLCLYVLGTSISGLVTRSRPEGSPIGIVIAAVAVLVMPALAFTKRRVAARIGSGALRGDAASSLTCGYMAGTVLVGLLLNAIFHWWWAEDVAALGFLLWLVLETREALEDARGGEEEQKGQALPDTHASDSV